MTATDELHRLLDERDVEYETNADECGYDEQPSTTWDFNLCGLEMVVTAKEFVDTDGKTYLEIDFHHAFTPEQAIATTLGGGELSSRTERTYMLEELVLDLYADLMEYGCTPNAHRANYKPRFEALGIEVSE